MTTDSVTILPPAHALTGKVSPPGSKSITNRALLLAGLAKGTSRLTGALKSDDTRYMAEALRQMGVIVEEPDATTFVVTSTGELKSPAEALFLGNAGTATRFLTAALALGKGRYIVDGDEHMRKRPIKPLVEALQSLGVAIAAPSGCPPVAIDANGAFKKNHVVIDAGLSSQYVSALQMAAACGSEPFTIELAGADIGARGYIDLTLSAMRAFCARVEQPTPSSWVIQPTGYTATDFHIEPDASAATYLWGAEVLTKGQIDIGTPSEAFTQPDAKAYDVIAQFPNMPAVID
ncbi:MAG: 3-phosphoshikimate 1-carboxyvinyltransferase, partial [Allorhizobium sp.]